MIYYLTRSFHPSSAGGALIRTAQVDGLKKHFPITVVTPQPFEESDANIIRIPLGYNTRVAMYLQRLGLINDYLTPWAKKVFKKLKDKITDKDVVFATTGGEMGMIYLGYLLKQHCNCKLVINFHDPIDYTIVGGKKLDHKFHVSREKLEKKLVHQADAIVTSSDFFRKQLTTKYPELDAKTSNSYFGFISSLEQKANPANKDKIEIVYAGNFGPLQSPDILVDIVKQCKHKDKVQITLIGNYEINQKVIDTTLPNVKKISFMPREELLAYLSRNADIGFASLTSDYLAACFPSKIFEYINLGLPTLGALPLGDAVESINSLKMGVAKHYADIKGLAEEVDALVEHPERLSEFRESLSNQHDKWHIARHIEKLVSVISSLGHHEH